MSNFSGQDIVAQERCKIVYANFADYIIKCYDHVKREIYLFNPGWWGTNWDATTKVLTNEQFELRGVDFTDIDVKLPLLKAKLGEGVTALSVKLTADEYFKWRVYPVATLPICNIDQSWLYGLIPYNLFCSQMLPGVNFYLLKPAAIVSNLVKVGDYLKFTLAPVVNFINPKESLTEPMDITMALVGLGTEAEENIITAFSIETIDNKQYVQVSENIKYMKIVESQLYSDSLKGSKFYVSMCFDTLRDFNIDCLSSITFYDQATSTTLTRTCIVLKNTDEFGNQIYQPHYEGNTLKLGNNSLKFLNYTTKWEEITETYLRILPATAFKVVLLLPECEVIILKDKDQKTHIIDMAEHDYECLSGDLTLTTLCGTYDEILALYPTIRYPIFYSFKEVIYPTAQHNLNACLMVSADHKAYYINDSQLPLYWDKVLNKFTGDAKWFFDYKLINQKIVYSDSSIKIQGLDYDRFGTRPYEIEFKYYKWDTIDKVFVLGPASEAVFTFEEYDIKVALKTDICQVKYEVLVNGVYDHVITSILAGLPTCDFPRQYDQDICDCKTYYCVDMGDTMLMACEVISDHEGKSLPYCMGWPGETKIPYKDVVHSTCEEPQVCTKYGCVDPNQLIFNCTTDGKGITEIPACDWFAPTPEGIDRFNAPVLEFYFTSSGDIVGRAKVTLNRGTIEKRPYWNIDNIYNYLTPNEYTDIDGNSYVIDPMYFIYLKFFASELSDPLNPLSWPKVSWPFTTIETNIGKIAQILPGLESNKWNWSRHTTMPIHLGYLTMQPCSWMTISVENTRDYSRVRYNFHRLTGIDNVVEVTPYQNTSLQAAYDAYCEKVKWLVNEDAYAYAVYMGYLDPAVGITV